MFRFFRKKFDGGACADLSAEGIRGLYQLIPKAIQGSASFPIVDTPRFKREVFALVTFMTVQPFNRGFLSHEEGERMSREIITRAVVGFDFPMEDWDLDELESQAERYGLHVSDSLPEPKYMLDQAYKDQVKKSNQKGKAISQFLYMRGIQYDQLLKKSGGDLNAVCDLFFLFSGTEEPDLRARVAAVIWEVSEPLLNQSDGVALTASKSRIVW